MNHPMNEKDADDADDADDEKSSAEETDIVKRSSKDRLTDESSKKKVECESSSVKFPKKDRWAARRMLKLQKRRRRPLKIQMGSAIKRSSDHSKLVLTHGSPSQQDGDSSTKTTTVPKLVGFDIVAVDRDQESSKQMMVTESRVPMLVDFDISLVDRDEETRESEEMLGTETTD